MMKKMVVNIACCWLREIVEMKRPTPRVLSMKARLRAKRSGTLPRTGTRNHHFAAETTKADWMRPMRTKGRSLPTMS